MANMVVRIICDAAVKQQQIIIISLIIINQILKPILRSFLNSLLKCWYT